ncbi:MAG: biotin carboxylase N-terminal domain-containing protein [Gammaproteobacteria bacterium]|nr:biotin carboxylase N-terminal domain-containing protein [Gammaproteobacteria bacterium]
MFHKILIANRGEIALRINHTAQKLGIQTVGIYSEVDSQARHIRACNEAYSLGGNAPSDSYLSIEKILAIAKLSGAQAIHPGYGFLSENADFANACTKENVIFVGPPAIALQAMGSKSEAKSILQPAGVPLLPGYHGTQQDPRFLLEQAQKIGFPLMIKASAGGGGRGMRIVRSADTFLSLLESCQREALNSFANPEVLLEKYLDSPRHIEIQILADAYGNALSLFERDCSVQRRHQKVIEESPAPGMTAEMRKAMGDTAVGIARSVGYTGAGTVEFIVETDPTGHMHYYFMEMNTRLQVEHPVTEAITGLDLVEWQLRIADGEKLTLQPENIHPQGHAIEVRLCAENPQQGFLPAIGKLQVFHYPTTWSPFTPSPIRLDCGFQQGDTITAYYDSLLGKLIVHADDRPTAIRNLIRALEQIHIVGLHNNRQFLHQLLQSNSFQLAHLDTQLIEREAGFLEPEIPIELTISSALAHLLCQQPETSKPAWDLTDGWQALGLGYREILLKLENKPLLQVRFKRLNHKGYSIHYQFIATSTQSSPPVLLHSQDFVSDWYRLSENAWNIHLPKEQVRVDLYAEKNILYFFSRLGTCQMTLQDPLSLHHKAENQVSSTQTKITTPMPGKILRILVGVKDKVVVKQALAVLEAMKMEHTLVAPFSGTVESIRYHEGSQVDEGVEIIQLIPESEGPTS